MKGQFVDDRNFDFKNELNEILSIPGVTQRRLAEWADVDASTVTRWVQGMAAPHDPVSVLQRLRPFADRARDEIVALRRTELDSWKSLTTDLSAGLSEHVEQTGLFASSFYNIACWVPTSSDPNEGDVVIVRYFDGLWADMTRRHYNIGDQSQTVSLASSGDGPGFDQACPIREIATIRINVDEEVGRSYARLNVQLNLADFQYRDDSIGFVDGFGYRFRGTKAFVRRRVDAKQTNDFLGTPTPILCRRLRHLICIPRACVTGSPSALSSNNRSMLRLIMELDNASPDQIESILWPQGRRYEFSSAPDAPLKAVLRVRSLVDKMPSRLQDALKAPANMEDTKGETIQQVLEREDSLCYMLDLHTPQPLLTHIIIWRLPLALPSLIAQQDKYGDDPRRS